ncbi:MAG: DUF2723 domain-containing protein [Patescibacteria group bacterium]|nr:DUF2723 domain-containing protein [Patescibacteria group bacterium]
MLLGIKKYFLAIFLFFLTSSVYIHNLSRSVFGGDVGDFVTSAIVMGVPHPSGYPLITFLGFLLTRIHFLTPAFMVGLISAFSASLAVVIFYFFSLKLTENKLISFVSALVLAFNYLFWFYAEIAEVFALNNFFVILLTLLAFLYYKHKTNKYFYLLAFFTGLSLTNNYIVSFIFPSVLILVLTNYKEIFRKPKTIFIGLILGLLGLSVYLYIPIASFFNPPVNWGNVKDIGSFFAVLSRKFYGTFGVGLTPNLNLMQKLVIQKNYFLYLVYQLTIPVIFICILGTISLLKKSKLLLIVLLLGFILSGPVFIALIGLPLLSSFYIGIYERFYSMSAVILLFFFPLGLQFLVRNLNKIVKKNTYEKLFIAIFFIIPLLFLKYNFNKTDLHNIWVGDNLAYDLMSYLPQNSILVLSGDTPLFNTWYVHYGLKVRPDITLLSMVGNNNYQKLEENYLKKFPKESKNPALIVKVLYDISGKVPVFSQLMLQPAKGKQLVWVPHGLVYELESGSKKILSESEFLKAQSRIWDGFKNKNINKIDNPGINSLTISDINYAYSIAMVARGDYVFRKYQDSKTALAYFKRAIDIDSNNANAYLALATFQIRNLNCKETQDSLYKAMDLDPFNSKIYYFLYLDYKFCFKNVKKSEDVVRSYNKIFKGDFFKDYKVSETN